MNFRAFLTALLICILPASLLGQSGNLSGRIEDGRYYAPNGIYSIRIPVLPELGGTMSESEFVVTFQDAFTVHASVACFPMDATQRWESETRGRRDYLIWFFSNFIQADLQNQFPGTRVESAKLLHGIHDGALLTYNLLPGGTMFGDRIDLLVGEPLPVAKRGNLLFVHNNHVFVLSIELAEKVLERRTSTRTVEEEDTLLSQRLYDLLARIELKP